MLIDIYSDVVCPWCFIGKRHLDKALQEFSIDHAAEVTVVWRPFQLNPDMPLEGMARQRYVESKFGNAQRAAEIYERVGTAGRNAGIGFEFDRIETQPNTLNAHRLIHYAQQAGKQDALVTRLFEGFFLEGADLSQSASLSKLAAESGLTESEVQTYLASDTDANTIRNADAQARALGIQGVPFFVFNQRYAISGAQPPEALLSALRQIANEAAGETHA